MFVGGWLEIICHFFAVSNMSVWVTTGFPRVSLVKMDGKQR